MRCSISRLFSVLFWGLFLKAEHHQKGTLVITGLLGNLEKGCRGCIEFRGQGEGVGLLKNIHDIMKQVGFKVYFLNLGVLVAPGASRVSGFILGGQPSL